MKFFTADLHLNHKALLKLGNGRPFNNIEEMNNAIISKWNEKISKTDDVYVLGDMFWGMNEYQIQSVMDKLKGHKHLIIGNHDKINAYAKSNRFTEIVNYKVVESNNQYIVLNHYPIFEWEGYYYGTYHLYGHTHGTLNLAEFTSKRSRINTNCWDVGVDNNNFEPVSFEEIRQKIENNRQKMKVENNYDGNI